MTAPHTPPPHPRSLAALRQRHGDAYKWRLLIAMSVGMVASVMSATIFNVATPHLMRDFGLGHDAVQWAVTAYMAAMTVAMLPTAWLIDRFGFRHVFLGALVILGIGSIGGALSPAFGVVVAMRILQGLAAGMLQPMSTLMVLRAFPLEDQGRAMGLLGFGIVLAPAVAPVLGGFLVDHFGWRPIFLIVLPGCIPALIMGHFLMPLRDVDTPSGLPPRHGFDWWGLGLLGTAILALLQTASGLHAHGFTSLPTVIGVSIATLALALFVRHSRRVPGALIQASIFRDRPLRVGTVVAFTYGLGLFGSTYLLPVFMQTVLHFNATSAGLVLLPSGIALALMMPVAGNLTNKLATHRQTAAGMALFALAFFMFFAVAYGEHPAWLAAGLTVAAVVSRIGLALTLPALNIGSLRTLPKDKTAQGSSLTNCVRQVGGTMGISLGAVFVETRSQMLGGGNGAEHEAFAEAFLIIGALFILATVIALGMKAKTAQPETVSE